MGSFTSLRLSSLPLQRGRGGIRGDLEPGLQSAVRIKGRIVIIHKQQAVLAHVSAQRVVTTVTVIVVVILSSSAEFFCGQPVAVMLCRQLQS